MSTSLHAVFAVLIACFAMPASNKAAASTIVRFDTSLGDIDVRLFNGATPLSVVNFLNYVFDGDYDDSFIHRAPPGFVLQGGGFAFPEDGGIVSVPTDPPVLNEPVLTNIRGTLAYAKQGGDPNSATSGWFFSVGDNSLNLDNQNGGFTVFGTVVQGLGIIDDIAALDIVNAGVPFDTLPVLDTFVPTTVTRDDLVFINTVEVLNFSAGDYNFDGVVDLNDFAVWQAGFGNTLRLADLNANTSASSNQDADGNGSGNVNAADFTVFRDNFGAVSAASVPLVSAPVSVPEPATITGSAALFLFALGRRRRC